MGLNKIEISLIVLIAALFFWGWLHGMHNAELRGPFAKEEFHRDAEILNELPADFRPTAEQVGDAPQG